MLQHISAHKLGIEFYTNGFDEERKKIQISTQTHNLTFNGKCFVSFEISNGFNFVN